MSTMSMPQMQMQLTTLTRRSKSTYVYDPLAWQLVCLVTKSCLQSGESDSAYGEGQTT
jgi:hypothetical protein